MLKTGLMKYSYMLNFIAVIFHEMDAIFWKEWRLFGISDDLIGRKIFIVAHLPIYLIIILSINALQTLFGRIASLIFSSFLIAHFFLHYNALVESYFNDTFSFGIISCILLISVTQLLGTMLSFRRH